MKMQKGPMDAKCRMKILLMPIPGSFAKYDNWCAQLLSIMVARIWPGLRHNCARTGSSFYSSCASAFVGAGLTVFESRKERND